MNSKAVNNAIPLIKILRYVYNQWNHSNIIIGRLKSGYVSIDNTLNSNIDSPSIYLKVLNKNTVQLSDFGYTAMHLEINNIKISKSPIMTKIFKSVLKISHIKYDSANKTLYTNVPIKKVPSARIKLLKAIIRIEDISYLDLK